VFIDELSLAPRPRQNFNRVDTQPHLWQDLDT